MTEPPPDLPSGMPPGWEEPKTPLDRLRDVGLTPDLPRDELRMIVAEAVQEVQERLDQLEADRRTWARRFRSRARRERP